jgi:hypothetical protein
VQIAYLIDEKKEKQDHFALTIPFCTISSISEAIADASLSFELPRNCNNEKGKNADKEQKRLLEQLRTTWSSSSF